ncbi:MAG: YafY family transcriptional regulator [Bryobacteraceae bacterium]|nr:YafY family transcriptional regulator [Bryobacteraceae bacterium]
MNRTDRLLGILLELQRHKRVRAEDLAARFETSKRTIYRDIQALSETGVPIAAQAGLGYSLVEGYFLPPVSFSRDEAIMLVLGANFMAGNFEPPYDEAARTAVAKIEAVLEPKTREQVESFRDSIFFAPHSPPVGHLARTVIPQLRSAVLERRRIEFTYHTRFRGSGRSEQRQRQADPYAMVNFGPTWYLIAYCHLREDLRSFRADRLSDLRLLDQRFERPAGFRPREEDDLPSRTIEAKVLFDREAAPWVRESMSYYATAVEDTKPGLLVTLRVRVEDEILHWILSWGSRARVLAPESLRQRLVEHARGVLRNYSSPE